MSPPPATDDVPQKSAPKMSYEAAVKAIGPHADKDDEIRKILKKVSTDDRSSRVQNASKIFV